MTASRRALLSAFLAAPATARAQSLDPNRPVRWIVPFTPGGGSDIASRVITGSIAELPGAPRFVIEARLSTGELERAEGATKRVAEHAAAAALLKRLET